MLRFQASILLVVASIMGACQTTEPARPKNVVYEVRLARPASPERSQPEANMIPLTRRILKPQDPAAGEVLEVQLDASQFYISAEVTLTQRNQPTREIDVEEGIVSDETESQSRMVRLKTTLEGLTDSPGDVVMKPDKRYQVRVNFGTDDNGSRWALWFEESAQDGRFYMMTTPENTVLLDDGSYSIEGGPAYLMVRRVENVNTSQEVLEPGGRRWQDREQEREQEQERAGAPAGKAGVGR